MANNEYKAFLSLSNIKDFEVLNEINNPFPCFPEIGFYLNRCKRPESPLRILDLQCDDFEVRNLGDRVPFYRDILNEGYCRNLNLDLIEKFQNTFIQGFLPTDIKIGYHQVNITNGNKRDSYLECVMPNSHKPLFLKTKLLSREESPKYDNIITGSCLGGIDLVNAITEDGKIVSITKRGEKPSSKITELVYNRKMSVYEISNIIEITNLINAISESNPELKSVTINSPGGGYYLYPLEYYIQGFISPEQLLEYFDFIDQKEFSLFESLSKRIKKPIKVNIQTCLGLDFKKKIRHYVSTINYPDNSSLIKAICESIQDPIYKKLLLDFNSITLQNLANIDYMTTYLKQANGTLIVENYLEDFILRKALKIAKKQSLDTKKLKGGVYIFPRVVANLIYGSDNSIKNSLYEAEGKLDISTIKEIIRFYRAELIRSESQYLKLHQGYWNEKYNLTKQNQITHRHQSQLNSTPSPVD